jgi:hypothetical protein
VSYFVVGVVALLASCLTFFSGFGLGTLLLPVFALFFPLEQAVALTAVVHMLNGLFKLTLVGRHASLTVVVRFGLPAIAAAFVGAWLLNGLSGLPAIFSYTAFERSMQVMPVSLVVGTLLLLFASMELLPRLRNLSFPPAYMPLGGIASGFFGGLAGMQGALRSAFLVRSGLSKESFIGTGVVIACLIDVSRLGVYVTGFAGVREDLDYSLLSTAVVAAFAGAVLGNRYLQKMTMPGLQRIVAVTLFVVAIALIIGVL